jgi:hypothetical protein
MKRIFCLAVVVFMAVGHPAWAQQNEIASLKAELAKQQAVIAQLLIRVQELETRQTAPVTKEDLQREAQTQQDAVNSVRESLFGRVNLNGYYNSRFSADSSETPNSFQQHHLGVLLGKQLGRFNVFTELELQNVPHHAEIRPAGEGEGDEHAMAGDVSGEGQVAVENAWMEYNHNRYLNVRVGKQLSPQYWWQNHYPNLTYSTDTPIYLRELFPPELVGVMVHGTAAGPVGTSEFGVGYKLYVANNSLEGNERADLSDKKSWGARGQIRLPVSGAFRRFDVAADMYRGRIALTNQQLVNDNVFGVDSQIEVDRFMLNTEYARGRSQEVTRFGYYVQPAVRLSDNWLGYYRNERVDSERVHRFETRHLGGINYRPFPQIALKLEFYRSVPKAESEGESGEEHSKPFNGVATGAVFFF